MSLSLTLLLGSCKKNNDNGSGAATIDYYIKFTLDGVDALYLNIAEGNMNVVDGNGKYTFTGGALKVANIAGSNSVALIVSNATPMTTNINYTSYTYNVSGFQRAAYSTLGYTNASGITFVSWGDEYSNTGVISNSKINFTEITTTNLKGTFSGTVYKSLSGTSEKHVLTKGEFNLKRR